MLFNIFHLLLPSTLITFLPLVRNMDFDGDFLHCMGVTDTGHYISGIGLVICSRESRHPKARNTQSPIFLISRSVLLPDTNPQVCIVVLLSVPEPDWVTPDSRQHNMSLKISLQISIDCSKITELFSNEHLYISDNIGKGV